MEAATSRLPAIRATRSRPREAGEVGASPATSQTTVDVVIPVFNEAHVIDDSVRTLHAYLRESLPYPFTITIADNASTDGTLLVAQSLAGELAEVRVIHLPEKGRGRALRRAWTASEADVVAYMDVDLSTDLAALLPLIAPLASGHSDVAIGTRLGRGSRVERSPRRELISRSYNRLLRTVLRAQFSDAQCGFKALRADVARELIPAVSDEGWFFDTELLVCAERAGMRIHEVPVDWVEDPDSRVAIVQTALDDLRGTWRLRKQFTRRSLSGLGAGGQVLRFAAVGVFSTILYIGLYLGLRAELPPQLANAVALGLSAVANTAANRRFTFGRRGRGSLFRHHTEGLAVFGLCLALTSGTLALLGVVAPDASPALETIALCLANALGTALRFILLRFWVFGPRTQNPRATRGQTL